MNVRASRLAGNSGSKGVVGNVQLSQLMDQPDSFGLVRIQSDIDTPAVVKTKRAVRRGFTSRADGNGPCELTLKGGIDPGEIEIGKRSSSIKPLHHAARPKRRVEVDLLFGRSVFSQFLDEFSAISGQIQGLAAELQIFEKRCQSGTCYQSGIHQFLRARVPVFLPLNESLGGGDHLIRLLPGKVFDSRTSVKCTPQDHVVARIREFRLRLIQTRAGNAAVLRHGPQPFHFHAFQFSQIQV